MNVQSEGIPGRASGSRTAIRSWLAETLNRSLESASRRRAAEALRGLDDRMLRDIGLQRSKIMAAAYLDDAVPMRRPGEDRSAGIARLATGAAVSMSRGAPHGEFPDQADWIEIGRTCPRQDRDLAA